MIGVSAALGAFYFFPPKEKVPSLVGISYTRAQAELKHLGLGSYIKRQYNSSVPKGDIVSQKPFSGSKIAQGSKIYLDISKGPAPRSVPSLSGETQASAIQSLANAGFVSHVSYVYNSNVAKGSVVSWSPNQGLQPNGSTVNVNISQGPPLVSIPNIVGQSYSQASASLTQAGLSPVEVKVFSSTVAVGNVVRTTPSISSQVPQGSTVQVDVSKGPNLVKVPNVGGDSLTQAKSILTSAGLKIGNVYGPQGSSVIFGTNPSAGQSVLVGSYVDLYTI